MEYTWNCRNVEVYTSVTLNGTNYTDVVYSVNWELTATEGSDSQTHIGFTNLDISDLSSFTAYSTLTNSTVAGWVEAAIGTSELTDIKSALAKIITDRQIVTSGSESRTLPE